MAIDGVHLPADTARVLEEWQSHVNAMSTHAERVRLARETFERRNRRGDETFATVRRTLASMCGRTCRCMYCEDSAACDIEHFRPKALYPELVFVWMNYLYACGNCNRIKRDHFRILLHDATYVDLKHGIGAHDVATRKGTAVLIDPRTEDPRAHMSLDLVDTFRFLPVHAEGTIGHARASYTITRLRLNERDELPEARRGAYRSYRALLREYVKERDTPAGAHVGSAINRVGHPTVWAEMKSQADKLRDLLPLFRAAPEALAW